MCPDSKNSLGPHCVNSIYFQNLTNWKWKKSEPKSKSTSSMFLCYVISMIGIFGFSYSITSRVPALCAAPASRYEALLVSFRIAISGRVFRIAPCDFVSRPEISYRVFRIACRVFRIVCRVFRIATRNFVSRPQNFVSRISYCAPKFRVWRVLCFTEHYGLETYFMLYWALGKHADVISAFVIGREPHVTM